ncbi:MAG: ASKHA domain-containing protein [Dorea sp.]|nr:ASKHA domain-containing protein [Dorea sp.]
MAEIRIRQTGQVIRCEAGAGLLNTLLDAGVFVDNPCSGKGICGKCKVRILSGEVSAMSETEEKLLKPEEIRTGIRLSCLTEVMGDITVELLQKERKHEVLTKGYMPAFEKDPYDGGYGIVIDIGTTTVVTALIDLASGKELANASMINAQKHYGLDVLTRITYEYEHPESGIQELQEAIVHSINAMIGEACLEASVDRNEIREIDVAANCTMMHMLLGVDARSIGKSPYRPKFTEAQRLLAVDIGIEAAVDTILYCLPQVSAYIGADIVAGAYVCELQKEKGNVLFIDIGTNGEIVLASQGRLLCCSCAAGPALEGMNISSGMRAAEGAIEDVRITEQGIELKTIGEQEPAGICGSGILAVVKELLRTGIVKKTGVFVKKEKLEEDDYRYPYIRLNGTKREFILHENPELLVTQGDVRQVQLAKGAILSGFVALLNKAGIRMEDLDKVMIAGQFGAHLPAESLVGTGILPEEVGDKLVYVGNSSKTGAYMTLMSATVKKEVEELARQMEYMELAETENYERIFTESMIFPTF